MSDRQILKAALASTPECLSLQQLETLANRQTQAPPHLLQCPRCQAELAMLKSFESPAPLPGEGAAVAWISSQLERQMKQIKNPSRAADMRSRSGAGARSWFARLFVGNMRFATLAAACGLIAVTTVLLLRSPEEPKLHASLNNESPVYRSEQIKLLSPVGDVLEVPKHLDWQAFPGATSYKIELMEVDQSVFWSNEVKDTSVTIPEKTRASIVVSKPILWQVTAVGPTGTTLAVSSTQRFVYREHAGSSDSLLPQ